MTRTRRAITAAVYGQQTRFFLWVPVCLGLGIAMYFSYRVEPGIAAYVTAACAIVTGALCSLLGGEVLRVLGWVPLWIAIGFSVAGARAHRVSEPVLAWRFHGAVEGRVIHIDRSASDVPRVTLADPVLSKVAPDATPARVRVALHGTAGTALVPGARIMLTAHLSPPNGPVEPGGFDFQRKAWFERLGAVGYARAPPVLAEPPDLRDFSGALFARRMRVADGLRHAIPGQRGAFAAAILTGDRSAIDPAHLEDLRRSNLAHLLAISGLHMGLLTGFVFAVIRFALALVPPLALRVPTKKIAAVVALIAGAGYLALSGANVATQRAFVMVAVMLCAILFDRAAISLRAVAIAALLILIVRPESLTEPGFQMSFAATTALVAVFEALNRHGSWRKMQMGRARWLAPAVSLLIASMIAAAATAPVAAFHFNRIAQYGLIANLASVPVMGVVVMPSGVIAGVLAPVGLEGAPLWLMGQGIGWILSVATWVGGFSGASVAIQSTPTVVLATTMMGLLFAVLWRGRLRLAGGIVAAVALAFWTQADRPVVLISADGKLVGVATPEGRVLNKAKGSGFAARTWLENDGDDTSQSLAALRGDLGGRHWLAAGSGPRVAFQRGKTVEDQQVAQLCASADVVILPEAEVAQSDSCHLIAKNRLKASGAIAVYDGPGGLRVVGAAEEVGSRVWNTR